MFYIYDLKLDIPTCHDAEKVKSFMAKRLNATITVRAKGTIYILLCENKLTASIKRKHTFIKRMELIHTTELALSVKELLRLF